MSRRKPRYEAHVRLYQHELQSEAYRSLSPDARAMLVEFRALYDGRENRVHMSVREAMRRIDVGQRRAQQARDELMDRGWIRLLTPGTFTRKARHATEYALTNEPIGSGAAPKDFMRWRPQKNTVAVTTTDGSCDGYRGRAKEAKKTAHGSCDDYRQEQKPPAVGSCPDCTDKVPPEVPPEGGNDWLSENMGWRCRNGSLLNTCCLVCGVWTTANGYEFNSRKHSCDEGSRALYQERISKAGAFARYLPQSVTALQASTGAGLRDSASVTSAGRVTDWKTPKASTGAACNAVTDKEPEARAPRHCTAAEYAAAKEYGVEL